MVVGMIGLYVYSVFTLGTAPEMNIVLHTLSQKKALWFLSQIFGESFH